MLILVLACWLMTFLKGQYVNWAIAAAFGDNMQSSAKALAVKADLTDEATSTA